MYKSKSLYQYGMKVLTLDVSQPDLDVMSDS